MSAWLHRQRKSDLIHLADQAGMKDYDGLLKDELYNALDDHLRANASTLANKPAFEEYYFRAGSPVKVRGSPPRGASSDVEDRKPARRGGRRTTTHRVKEEIESMEESANELITSTPAAVSKVANRMTDAVADALPSSLPMPPSPSMVADAIDRQTAVVRSQLSRIWTRSGILDNLEYVRELASSVVGVEATVLLVEAWGLQRETLPWRYAFDVPAVEVLGTHSHAVFIPDFFLLVTSFFWSPSLLWAGTSLFIPLVFAYFFNMTLKRQGQGFGASRPTYQVDPLTFNIVKALVTWLVYAQGSRLGGLVGDHTVDRVEGAMPGGYKGVMIGAAIGAITSLYEAVLKK